MVIKSVRKGYGDKSLLFKVGLGGITRISEELKQYVFFHEKSAQIVVYRCYNADNKLLFEIESGDGIIISYMN